MKWHPKKVSEYTTNRKASAADRYILERIAELSPEKLIEVGCGPGIIASQAAIVTDYVCCDLAYEFLTVTSEVAPSAVCVNCTAESLPFSDNSSDCVLAMAVLHHLNNTALDTALRDIYRILKPEGRFILLEDWCFTEALTDFEEHARRWRFQKGFDENHLSTDEWHSRLALAGFTCSEPVWLNRPFSTTNSFFLRWPEKERVVRMMALESVKSL